MPRRVLIIGWWFVAFAASRALAESAYPLLTGVRPVAVQAGTTAECELSAVHNLHGAFQVFITGTGVEGKVVAAPAPPATAAPAAAPPAKPTLNKIKVAFTVAADAPLGVRQARVATPQGPSTVTELVVVRDPVISESAPNDTQATAQAIAVPSTVCGALEKAEDVDFYKFTVTEAKTLVFHVRSSRLEHTYSNLMEMHSDPIITLRDQRGSVLAINDNYFAADPLLSYQFTTPGEYFLEVRDVRFRGLGDWLYAIEIHDRPFAAQTFPLHVAPGAAASLQPIGFNIPDNAAATLNVPAEAPEGVWWATPMLGSQQLNSLPVVVCRLPSVLETPSENGTPAAAQPVAAPCAISGRIETPGDVDCYSFEAKAGEQFAFEVVARRAQSGLDSNLRVLSDKAEVKAEADDMNEGRFSSSDSKIESWTAPADGRWTVEISDLLARGGREFVYLLKITRSSPTFTLELDTDKTPLSPGSRGVIFVRCYRKNGFFTPIQLAIEGLPPGVTASCGKIQASEKDKAGQGQRDKFHEYDHDGCIILSAAPDAVPAAANIRVTGTAVHAMPDGQMLNLSAVAQPLQEFWNPGGGRRNFPVTMHTVSIGEASDIAAVKLSAQEISLKPGGSQKIDITVQRRPGFSSNVTLDVIYRHLEEVFGSSLPTGVSLDPKGSMMLLTGEQTQGHITLVAAADARPVDRQQVSVMANVSMNFVMKYTVSSDPLIVSVIAP